MRKARLHVPDIVHHLIWRFVDRGWFFNSDDERESYLWRLGLALDASDWRCLAYALMSNHIHLAVVAGHEPLAAWSRRVNTPFARWMNKRRGRLGPLFADRARDYALAPSRTATLLSYIHNNPARAGLARVDSLWTSNDAYVGAAPRPRWLHVDEGLQRAGFATGIELAEFARGDVAPAEVERVARAVKRFGAINVATPDETSVPLVIRPFARIRPDPRRIVELVCGALSVAPTEVCSRRRSPLLIAARRATVHAGRALGLTGSDLAAALGISEQGVSLIARTFAPAELCSRVCQQVADELRIGR